ncbi:hypothetical protein BRAS3843_240062 [Bradyrhizobium sp. STM 3843]|nr:hypothetical protein BRAS3843_240062 [Bradyrhizobium sp. STM 3843]
MDMSLSAVSCPEDRCLDLTEVTRSKCGGQFKPFVYLNGRTRVRHYLRRPERGADGSSRSPRTERALDFRPKLPLRPRPPLSPL